MQARLQFMAYGGDFGEPCHDGQFCCNGLVFPTRQPHPSLAEVAHCQSPIKLSYAGLAEADPGGAAALGVRIAVQNRQDWQTLRNVAVQWRLLVDGMPVPRSVALLHEDLTDGAMDFAHFAQVLPNSL